jgi:hypothetical protein
MSQEDPGDEFTREVLKRVRETRAEELAPVRTPLGERMANWFGVWLAPKPAFGVAMALVLGLAAGLGLQQLTGEESPQVSPSLQADQLATPTEETRDQGGEMGLRGLDRLPTGVTAAPVGGEGVGTAYPRDERYLGRRVEFVLEPYLVRDGGSQQVAEPLFPPVRQRAADGSQDGAYITF